MDSAIIQIHDSGPNWREYFLPVAANPFVEHGYVECPLPLGNEDLKAILAAGNLTETGRKFIAKLSESASKSGIYERLILRTDSAMIRKATGYGLNQVDISIKDVYADVFDLDKIEFGSSVATSAPTQEMVASR